MKTTHLHTGWTFFEKGAEDKFGELPADVPGHVHLDLMRAGIIGDPFYRMQELGSRWVDGTGWVYQTRFEWRPDPSLPKRVLRFEGLDTVCAVFLNDVPIGSFDNMFLAHEIDVSNALKEGENRLRIEFEAAQTVGSQRKAEYFAEQGLKETVARFEPRSFVRKAQYMFGWDWGPCLISCGIWKPVQLIEFASRLTDVWVRPSESDGTWRVAATSEQEGPGQARHRILAPDGSPIAEWDGDGEAEIPSPQLWWPHDLGAQPLYTLVSELEGHAVSKRFGLRTIRLIREGDELGQSFQFEVNGTPVWARGANWIPDHSFPSIVSRERYFDQFGRAKGMNMNMLRVWGGGLYESDDFYDAADELGILIWQDFTYGCAYYPDTGIWQDVAREEASQNVRRLRHRASLAHWCGNNENLAMWHHSWGGKENQPPRYYGEHLYDEVIPGVLAALDPDRPYTPSSPWGGEDCNQGGIGDQHYWDVWHGRGDWGFYKDSFARFSSEFGFSCSPSPAVWEACLADGDRDPRSPAVRWHDKTGKGYETYLGLIHLHYPEIQSLEDLVYYSQLNQRDGIRFAVERYRSGEFCKGALIWQINDCWPVQSWAMVDFFGHRKALGFELLRSFAPRLIALEKGESSIKLHAANDGPALWQTSVSLKCFGPDGAVRCESRFGPNAVGAFSRQCVGEFDSSGLPCHDTLVWVNAEGVRPTWTLLIEPKESAFACQELRVSVAGRDTLRIESGGPVVDLWLTAVDSATQFSPNFLTWPGGGVEVQASGSVGGLKARSLAGEHRLVFD